jgi:hypothetical protein
VSGRSREVLLARERMTPTHAGRRRKFGIDVQEARAWDVPLAVELAPAFGSAELPATVDELIAHADERNRLRAVRSLR